jgi:hypothetical protein
VQMYLNLKELTAISELRSREGESAAAQQQRAEVFKNILAHNILTIR